MDKQADAELAVQPWQKVWTWEKKKQIRNIFNGFILQKANVCFKAIMLRSFML